MRVYVAVEPPTRSRSLHRVADALSRYAPGDVEIVQDKRLADLVVLHAVGYPEVADWAIECVAHGQEFAVLTYCVRTTQKPSTRDWLSLWQGARLVWSYYDLRELCAEDGVDPDFDFYHSPLGVDGDVFKPSGDFKHYQVGTSGYVAATESIGECTDAVRKVGGFQFHLGPTFDDMGANVTVKLGISDAELAVEWSRCRYVSGLRRMEGFEMPVLEGIACGARPIVFDKPHYRQWFEDFAVFVPECPPVELTRILAGVFDSSDYRSVTNAERRAVVDRFQWEPIVAGFWDRVLDTKRAAA